MESASLRKISQTDSTLKSGVYSGVNKINMVNDDGDDDSLVHKRVIIGRIVLVGDFIIRTIHWGQQCE